MKKKDILTIGALIGLTILTAIFSTQFASLKYVSAIILLLSVLKFGLVTLNFMELSKANSVWKVLIGVYLLIFVAVILIIIQ